MKYVGGKFTIDNPFNLQEDEVSETAQFPALFTDTKYAKTLTYADMGRDRGLTDGYKITPKAVTQEVIEVKIDKTTFLA